MNEYKVNYNGAETTITRGKGQPCADEWFIWGHDYTGRHCKVGRVLMPVGWVPSKLRVNGIMGL